MVVKATDVRKMGVLQGKLFGAVIRATDVWWRRLSGIQFKVLLYDVLLVGVVTSGHVTNMAVTMAVTPFNPPFQKTTCYMYTSQLCLL